MYGVFLILVLALTGGVIAFIGDRLGTKIGKKRLSIFGLRPRHTSIVVTIVTGICITAVTFGIMAAVSENVRTALFGMEELNNRMKATQQSLDTTRSELTDAEAEKAQADRDLEASKKDVKDLKAEQAELEQESSRLREEGARLLAQNDALAEQSAALSAANEGLSAANTELTGKNETLTSENKDLEVRTKALREGLITVREGDIVFRAGEVLASGVIKGHRSEEEVRRDFDGLAQTVSRNVSFRLGRNVSDDQIYFYKPEFDKAISDIVGSNEDMAVRIQAAGNLVRNEPIRATLELYPNHTIYKDNEFILAKPMKPMSTIEARDAVAAFLHEVNTRATDRGLVPNPVNGSVGVVTGPQIYDIVTRISRERSPFVLAAYADGDIDTIEALRLRLEIEHQGLR